MQPQQLAKVFGVDDIRDLQSAKATLPTLQNEVNVRLHNLLRSIRNLRIRMATCYPNLYIVREDGDPTMRMLFLSQLIEDRLENNQSYPQFLASVREKIPTASN